MSSMIITVTNNGVSKESIVDMSFLIERCRPISRLNVIYFLTVLKGLKDADERAFMDALELFFKSELEQDDGKE